MPITVLLDENLSGLRRLCEGRVATSWLYDFAKDLGLRFVNFREAGLPDSLTDRALWYVCKSNGYILLTENRNKDGADALETVLRELGTESDPPVFTISDKLRFQNDGEYAERVLSKLIGHLQRMGDVLGAVRIYLP